MDVSHKNLTRRYLIWAYKTTKESFERIERKTTQLVIDEHLLKTLNKSSRGISDKDYDKSLADFRLYIASKKQDELKQKFADDGRKKLNPHYLYLKNRRGALRGRIYNQNPGS